MRSKEPTGNAIKPTNSAASAELSPALTKRERKALDNYLQEDHLSAIPHDHVDTEVTSPGEKIFNTVTYKGIGFLANAALSVYLTHVLMYGKGRPLRDYGIKKLTPFWEKLSGGNTVKAVERARASVFISGLFSGGTILLYPIKKLEDHKPKIVQYIDHSYNQFFTPDKATLAIQRAAHERLKKDPIPSWGNVLLGRLLGTAAVVIASIGIARNRDEKLANAVAEKTTELMKESNSNWMKRLGGSTRFKHMFGISLMELYTSFIAEEVLYLTTRIYKGMKRKQLLENASNDNSEVAHATPTEDQKTAALNITDEHAVTPKSQLDKVVDISAHQHAHEIGGVV